ncbi:MAG: calcium-binding protein, partial [Thermoleophilia bacterium]|nr:calcium-binding protein [Thermoleophilia bacterium]
VTSLTLNGVAVTLTSGTFTAAFQPTIGVNTLTLVAKDAAGNTTTITSTFTYVALTFNGTAGNDTLIGNALSNVLNGMGGDDLLDCGAGGNDQANGGDGNDTISCVEPLTTAKANADIVNCGAGTNDRATVDPYDKVIGCEKVLRVWIGSAKRDVAKGTRANDRFDLKAGNDQVTCGGGNDTVLTGAGNDVINCVDRGKMAKKHRDTVNCGAGRKDKATVDKFDKVIGCEGVTRV